MGAPEALGPLAYLGRRLVRRPPLLSRICEWLGEAEFYPKFTELVEEYLPDAGQEILRSREMAADFVEAFTERYFPLMEVPLEQLVQFIPVGVLGWEEEEYHDLPDAEPGRLLASLLVAGMDEGIRVTTLETASKLLPRGVLRTLSKGGYPLPFLEQVLPGSPYDGLVTFAQVLCHATGSIFWDLTPLNICPPQSGGWPYHCDWSYPEWSRENVDTLSEDWRVSSEIEERMQSFLGWLEADAPARFAQVLDYLEGRYHGRKGAKVGTP